MNPEHRDFLNLARLPGSISAEEAAILLGVTAANIPVLVAKSFLRPLGRPIAVNAPRNFSSTSILKLATDPDEMNRMHQILTAHNRARNGTKTSRKSVVCARKDLQDYASRERG